MQGPASNTTDCPSAPGGATRNPSRSADRVYQTVTIAAILLLLGSLWLF